MLSTDEDLFCVANSEMPVCAQWNGIGGQEITGLRLHVSVTSGEMISQSTIAAYPHILWHRNHRSRTPLLPLGGCVASSCIMNAIFVSLLP
jgi:hypothetical protein